MTETDFLPDSGARLDGVAIGVLMGFADDDGAPLVVFPGNARPGAVAARSTVELGPQDLGREVALLFEAADPSKPVVVGRLMRAGVPRFEVSCDGERLELTAEREVVLRCGKAAIILTQAGKILIRGTHILSRSSGANRIKGGSVQLN